MLCLNGDHAHSSFRLLVDIQTITQILQVLSLTIFLYVQLAASFAPRFHNNIFKCKRISETGAQQVNIVLCLSTLVV